MPLHILAEESKPRHVVQFEFAGIESATTLFFMGNFCYARGRSFLHGHVGYLYRSHYMPDAYFTGRHTIDRLIYKVYLKNC